MVKQGINIGIYILLCWLSWIQVQLGRGLNRVRGSHCLGIRSAGNSFRGLSLDQSIVDWGVSIKAMMHAGVSIQNQINQPLRTNIAGSISRGIFSIDICKYVYVSTITFCFMLLFFLIFKTEKSIKFKKIKLKTSIACLHYVKLKFYHNYLIIVFIGFLRFHQKNVTHFVQNFEFIFFLLQLY